MCRKYHGTIRTGSGVVYEGWYRTRGNALRDLKRNARETVLNSFDDGAEADFTLFLGGVVVAGGRIPAGRSLRGRYADPACTVYGMTPICGTKIC
jgi:hypothetical protein